MVIGLFIRFDVVSLSTAIIPYWPTSLIASLCLWLDTCTDAYDTIRCCVFNVQ